MIECFSHLWRLNGGMETIQLLGTALGLSALAGLNLYLTVFVSGLAIRLGWVQLSPAMQGLNALADPTVLVVAGVMLLVEFMIDKVAIADSAWDSIHTFVRPIGAMILSLKALGTVNPSMEIVGVLLGGSVAFATHATKAGTRLVANTSPEPFSNIALSLGEDTIVLGGLWFVYAHPIIALCLVIAFTAAFWYLFPKCFRIGRAHATAIIDRFRAKKHERRAAIGELPTIVPSFTVETWLTLQQRSERLAWVLPCFTGRSKQLGRYVRGCLFATNEGRLFFVGKKNFRMRIREVSLAGARLEIEQGRLYHRLIIQSADGEVFRWRFTRRYSPYLPVVKQWLEAERQSAVEIMPRHIGASI